MFNGTLPKYCNEQMGLILEALEIMHDRFCRQDKDKQKRLIEMKWRFLYNKKSRFEKDMKKLEIFCNWLKNTTRLVKVKNP